MPETKTFPKIDLCPCESSQIHAHGFDPDTGTMALQFKKKGGVGGAVYHYPNVTREQYADFCCAPSKGRHFGTNFKGKPEHPHVRLPDPEEPKA